jgi:AhpD family alkylhydroperoxidase
VDSYRKRRFTARSFLRHLIEVTRTLPRLARAYVKPTLSPALREKVMLATTAVNECRYCDWVHSRAAAAHGVDLDEFRALLADTEIAPRDDREALAVLYAQHYAQERGHADPELTRRLREAFGAQGSDELLAYIRGMCFANLAGNTLDAVLHRLRALRD